MAGNKEIDAVTGVETTGHVWDGDLKELNKPLPRWWLYTFYAMHRLGLRLLDVLSGLADARRLHQGHARLQPAQRGDAPSVAAAKAAQARLLEAVATTPRRRDREEPRSDGVRHARRRGAVLQQLRALPRPRRAGLQGLPEPQRRRLALGRHRSSIIEKTIRYGIRSGHAETHMPWRCRASASIRCSTATRSRTRPTSSCRCPKPGGDAAAIERGRKLFAEQCSGCHGEAGKGTLEMGAPNLTDGIWLYGDRKADIVETIRTGRGGVMPGWDGRLDPATIKMLAVYVHSLGGGK